MLDEFGDLCHWALISDSGSGFARVGLYAGRQIDLRDPDLGEHQFTVSDRSDPVWVPLDELRWIEEDETGVAQARFVLEAIAADRELPEAFRTKAAAVLVEPLHSEDALRHGFQILRDLSTHLDEERRYSFVCGTQMTWGWIADLAEDVLSRDENSDVIRVLNRVSMKNDELTDHINSLVANLS